MQNATNELTFGGVPTPARRRYVVKAALVLTAAAALTPVLATAANATPGAAIVQQGPVRPAGPADLAPPTAYPGDPTLAPVGADTAYQEPAAGTQDYAVLQIAGLGLLGAVTTIALTVNVLRHQATGTR